MVGQREEILKCPPIQFFPNQFPLLTSKLTPEPKPYLWEFTTWHDESLTDTSNGGTGEKKIKNVHQSNSQINA
jgi:hypothetical protein